MTPIGVAGANRLMKILSDQDSLAAAVGTAAIEAGIELPPPPVVMSRNIAPELAEKSAVAKYPSVQVCCTGLKNLLTEKFRRFSGRVQLAADVRVSQDRIEGLEELTGVYVQGVTDVLEQSRGDWGDGMFYAGEYEVSISPVKPGGRHFLQTARISFELEVSR